MRNSSAPLLLLLLSAALAAAAPTSAQPPPDQAAAERAAPVDPLLARTVLVIPVTDDPVASATARASLERALRELEFVPRDVEEAGDRFEERFSRPAPTGDPEVQARFTAHSEAAARALAAGDDEGAALALQEAQAIAAREAAELNRERRQATRVLDTCLYDVRARLRREGTAPARARLAECRELAPRAEPSRLRHPPEVVALLREHDEARAARADAQLTLTSTPPACRLRLGGVDFGETPARLETLSPGNYALQVECSPDERGRLHRVTLGSGDNHVHVDVRFDRALRSRPIVHFDPAGDDELRIAFAHRVARAFEHPVLVQRQLDPNTFELIWIDPGGPRARVISSVYLDPAVALRSLRAGRSEDLRSTPPTELAPPSLPDEPAPLLPAAIAAAAADEEASEAAPSRPLDTPPRLPRWRRALGWSLVGLGTLSLAAVPALQVERGSRGDRYVIAEPVDPDFLGRQNRWESMGVGVYVTSGAGGLLGIGGLILAAPPRARTPVAAWVAGGLGVAATGAALALGLSAPGGCENTAVDRRACVDRGQALGWTALAASAAGVLLSAPLLYLVERGRVQLDVDVARGGGTLRLLGTF